MVPASSPERQNNESQGGPNLIYNDVNRRGRLGGQTAGGHPKAFPRPRQPVFAVPALREIEGACRVSIL